jgi:DNA adenine methylase
MKVFLRYYGGKYHLTKKLLSLIPPHKTYVEVFGGAAHLLFRKQPSEVEIYNDINGDLVNFFRVLRDENKGKKLQELLELTPYSREEFYLAKDNLNVDDDIERARRFYVRIRQSFNGIGKTWSCSKKERKNVAFAYFNAIAYFDIFHARIRNTQIENDDFRKIIPRYDTPDTFFYLDPPYIQETRKTFNDYDYEMSLEDHQDLVNLLLKIKGKAMLSCYFHPVYQPLLDNGWIRKDFEINLWSSNAAKLSKRPKRTETLLMNYIK